MYRTTLHVLGISLLYPTHTWYNDHDQFKFVACKNINVVIPTYYMESCMKIVQKPYERGGACNTPINVNWLLCRQSFAVH